MNNLCAPAQASKDWNPGHHGETGWPALPPAVSPDFPATVRNAFKSSALEVFRNPEVILTNSDHSVDLPPEGSSPAKIDLFILAKGNDQLIAVTVGYKGPGPLGETVGKWKRTLMREQQMRMHFLCNALEARPDELDPIDCRLLHQTASVLVEAKNYNAPHALVLTHTFAENNDRFDEYQSLLSLFNTTAKPDSITFAKNIKGIDLYFGWVRGI